MTSRMAWCKARSTYYLSVLGGIDVSDAEYTKLSSTLLPGSVLTVKAHPPHSGA